MGLIHRGWTVAKLTEFQSNPEVVDYLKLVVRDFEERGQTEARAKHFARRRLHSMLAPSLDIMEQALKHPLKVASARDIPTESQTEIAKHVIGLVGVDTKTSKVEGVRDLNLKVMIGGRDTTLEFNYGEDGKSDELKAMSRERTRTAMERLRTSVAKAVADKGKVLRKDVSHAAARAAAVATPRKKPPRRPK